MNRFVAGKSLVAAGCAAASLLFLSGCNIVVQAPADLSTVAAPAVAVNIGLPGLYRAGTFSARLNEADITSQFTINAQSGTAAAALTLTPGSYVLDVRACWGLNIYFVTAPPWPVNGCSTARGSFTVTALTLTSIAPTSGQIGTLISLQGTGFANGMTIDIGGQTVTPGSVSPTTSATATIPNNLGGTVNVSVRVSGLSSGAQPFRVAPVLTSIAPSTGPVGTGITLTGTGFANGMTAIIGGQTNLPTTVSSATQATTSIPAGLTGNVNVSVNSAQQTSGARPFAVSPPPVQVYRMGDSNIQRVDVATPANPTVVGQPFSAGLSPGGMGNTVGCTRTASGLLRSTSTNIENCPVDAAGVIGPTCSSLAVPSSGTASDVAISGTLVVRSIENGIQTLRLNANGTLTLLGSSNNGTMSGVGSAVAFPQIAVPTVVVRAHANGIDVFDISNPAAPTRSGRITTAGISSTGVDVKVAGSTRVLRAFSNGLDLYDITNPSAPTLTSAGPLAVGLSSSRASLALFATNTRAVRSTSAGIEIFNVIGNPQLLGSRGGDLSSAAGTDVVMDVNGNAVRSSDESVEVYNVTTNPANPTLSGAVNVTPSATGVCIVNR